MVEATIGIVMILFVALMFMQVLLVFHASLAAHAAAQRAARDGALTGDPAAGTATAAVLQGNTLKIIKWQAPSCAQQGSVMQCTVTAGVPSMVPGGGLFMGGGWSGVEIKETGQYPMFDKGG